MYQRPSHTKRLLLTAVLAGGLAGFVAPVCADQVDPVYKLLTDDGAPFDYFGNSIGVSEGIIAVGSVANDEKGPDSGAVYLYEAVTGELISNIFPDDPKPNKFFGHSLAIDGNFLAVGSVGAGAKGAAYLFDASTGQQLFKLTASDGATGDEFGHSIAIDDGIVVVGAHLDDDMGTFYGSAYLFDVETGQEIAKLEPSDPALNGRFGCSVAIENGLVAVGACHDDDLGEQSGSVYLFDADTGEELRKLLPLKGIAGDYFGWSVAIDNGTVAVGAYGDDDAGESSGGAYLFEGATGAQIAKLVPDDGAAIDRFGHSISFDFGVVAVGAHWSDPNGFDSGTAYLFDGYNGELITALLPLDGAARDHFGVSIAIYNGVIAVGAWQDDDNGLDAGSAYVYDINCLKLTVQNLVAGDRALFTITGGTPGDYGITLYGLQEGRFWVNGNARYCATFGFKDVQPSHIIGGKRLKFDFNGEMQFTQRIHESAGGMRVMFQTAVRGLCPNECMSNMVELVVQD